MLLEERWCKTYNLRKTAFTFLPLPGYLLTCFVKLHHRVCIQSGFSILKKLRLPIVSAEQAARYIWSRPFV